MELSDLVDEDGFWKNIPPLEDRGECGCRDGWMFSHCYSHCPEAPHRGPQGPNEDLSQCRFCGMPSWSKRPPGETFGEHLEDCSLDVNHESYCEPGGSGHPESRLVRGVIPPRNWPNGKRW